ncbi:MAG: MqnA/MqnD/SBP family protein [Clostridium sp.]|uniref:ABC transporter substrate-binding protein n=1 Tax=Clostridium sp. TaxID=1506 RepID=UPI00306A9CB7
MKKIFTATICMLFSVFLLVGCGQTSSKEEAGQTVPKVEEKIDINIATLKGPTTMGMVKLMSDSEAGITDNNYKVSMSGTADEIVAKIVKGDIDVAAVPCNLASVLYNKTQGEISIAAINTLGVLYIVENGNEINSIKDLKGKTIYSTGKGTTPEYVLNYLLTENGIDVTKDIKIEYKSEATEVAAILSEDSSAIAMLPQPFVTTAQSKNKNLRVALDMTDEWNKVQGDNGSALVTGVVIARNEFIKENNVAFQKFLEDYKKSTDYVNSNIDEASTLIEKYDIVPAAVAKKAIPLCNITYVDGNDMKTKVSGYLKVLFNQNPQSVGGTLPDDEFYYKK